MLEQSFHGRKEEAGSWGLLQSLVFKNSLPLVGFYLLKVPQPSLTVSASRSQVQTHEPIGDTSHSPQDLQGPSHLPVPPVSDGNPSLTPRGGSPATPCPLGLASTRSFLSNISLIELIWGKNSWEDSALSLDTS